MRELWRAFDGKLGGTYSHCLALRIKQLDSRAGDEKKEEEAWLGRALLDLAQRDRKSFRQIADALDYTRKPGEVFNRKRHRWLLKYCGLSYRLKRTPTIHEMNPANKNEARAIRKMLNAAGLPPLTDVPRGHRPKGAKDALKQWGIKRPSKAAS